MEFGAHCLRKISPEERDTYSRLGYWENITWGDLFERSTQDFPTNVALVCPDEGVSWTYAQLRQRVHHTATALLETGLKKGDRAMIQLPNWSEFVVIFFALQKIGVTPVLLLPGHGQLEVGHFCRLTGPAAWFVPLNYKGTEYAMLIEHIRKEAPELKVIVVGRAMDGMTSLDDLRRGVLPGDYPRDHLVELRPDPETDISYLMPTGGTTGLSKLVAHNHNTVICYIRAMGRLQCYAGDDNILISAPITHNMALTALLSTGISLGARVTVIQSTRARDVLETIQTQRITRAILIPTQIVDIVNIPNLEQYDFSSLRSLLTGAAYCPPEVAKRVSSLVPGWFQNCYGITEGGLSATRAGDPPEVFLSTQGLPSVGANRRKIVDEDGQEVPPGVEGELMNKGPDVFLGYYEAETDNRRVFDPEGYYHTGDLARFDHNGNLTITGRIKDVIRRGGESIPVAEGEDIIIAHPKVKNVALVGVPDLRLGERVCVFVELREKEAGLSLEEIADYMNKKGCSRIMIPERLEIIEEMPVTGAGKTDKKKLRALVAPADQQV